MSCPLSMEKIWIEKPMYDEAERKYYEKLSMGPLTPLAGEVAKARQRLIEIKDTFNDVTPAADNTAMINLEKKVNELDGYISALQSAVQTLRNRVEILEAHYQPDIACVELKNMKEVTTEEENEVDLFASDSDNDEAADKLREERLAAYAAKKSKKPTLIAKSNIIFDVKPWDDETDMKQMEVEVRKIETDGLLWGPAKLVPLAYGIHKLQISCVVEDDKVSVDWLQEQIEAIDDYVQSVDIAAFNKV